MSDVVRITTIQPPPHVLHQQAARPIQQKIEEHIAELARCFCELDKISEEYFGHPKKEIAPDKGEK